MGGDVARATISVGEKRITFEGPADFVRGEVARYVRPGPGAGEERKAQAGALLAARNGEGPETEEEFLRSKKPRGHSEIVAVLAFFLGQQGVTEFGEDDIKRAYLRAKVRPPKVVSQAIRDARNNFDYIEAGSKRGAYKLSNHGERTVMYDLPRAM